MNFNKQFRKRGLALFLSLVLCLSLLPATALAATEPGHEGNKYDDDGCIRILADTNTGYSWQKLLEAAAKWECEGRSGTPAAIEVPDEDAGKAYVQDDVRRIVMEADVTLHLTKETLDAFPNITLVEQGVGTYYTIYVDGGDWSNCNFELPKTAVLYAKSDCVAFGSVTVDGSPATLVVGEGGYVTYTAKGESQNSIYNLGEESYYELTDDDDCAEKEKSGDITAVFDEYGNATLNGNGHNVYNFSGSIIVSGKGNTLTLKNLKFYNCTSTVIKVQDGATLVLDSVYFENCPAPAIEVDSGAILDMTNVNFSETCSIPVVRVGDGATMDAKDVTVYAFDPNAPVFDVDPGAHITLDNCSNAFGQLISAEDFISGSGGDEEQDPDPITPGGEEEDPIIPGGSTSGVESYKVSMIADDNNPADADLMVGSEIRAKINIIGTTADGGETDEFYSVRDLKVTFTPDFFTASVEGEGSNYATVDNDASLITINRERNESLVNMTDADLPILVFTVVKSSFDEDYVTGNITLEDVKSVTTLNASDYLTGAASVEMEDSVISATLTKTTTDPGTGEVVTPGNTVDVTFSAGDHGTINGETTMTMTVVKGATITEDDLPGVTANSGSGYSFADAWIVDGKEVEFPYTAKESVTFNAKYNSESFVIGGNPYDPDDPDPNNPGWENIEGGGDPTTGEAYTGKIVPYLPDVFTYEVSYGQGDDRSGIADVEDGTFTIPGESVMPGLGITIEATLKGTAEVYGYAANVAMILIKAGTDDGKLTGASAEAGGYTYHDQPMLWSDQYHGYVYLVKAVNGQPAHEVGNDITFAAGTVNEAAPAPAKDVNGNGTTDDTDATYIISIIKGTYSAYITDSRMVENYLRADLSETDLNSLGEQQIINIADYQAWFDQNS